MQVGTGLCKMAQRAGVEEGEDVHVDTNLVGGKGGGER